MAQASSPSQPLDPVAFAAELIRCPSVTPEEGGALDLLQARLEALGFICTRLPFSDEGTPDVDNLYARIGTEGPNFCFAGHTDVVPVGDEAAWSADPFGGEIRDGVLFGRGATDMKSAIAAFAAAAERVLKEGAPKGSISFLITGDEEGPAVNGTQKMLDWCAAHGEVIDDCLVGEPTNPRALGDMIKIGRRGSVNGWLTAYGAQGHVAYPHLADNPVPRMAAMLSALAGLKLDEGTEHFQPSNLEITTVDVGNSATNVIPAEVRAHFNIRFNDLQTAEGLEVLVRGVLDKVCQEMGGSYDLVFKKSGDAFLTAPGRLSDIVAGAVEKVTGRAPELSTSGGTSDARFIKNHARVIEFGLVSQSMHKVDEHIAVKDIEQLTDIYEAVLRGYFGT
ncbi:succinyl-diaminopimelate desuccinylase [Tepidicaulis sp.]|uniref:succinyl-diaminopimelate desuccinylase n=1 Tax=Tepidicaulis sp. TaxID=1920809 RepID=UPI003B59D00E